MSKDCLFCKIAQGAIPAAKVHEDERFVVIQDIRPQAKVHWLVIPKEHVPSLDEAFPAQGSPRGDLVDGMFRVAVAVARSKGLLPGGFRSVINTGAQGGQTVFHIHLHVLGGQTLGEEFG